MHLKNMLKGTVAHLIIFILLFLAVTVFYYGYSFTRSNHIPVNTAVENAKGENQRLKQFALQAKVFCKKKAYNTQICFLLDMSLPSGKNRFFQYDLNADSIIDAGLVAHGSCNTSFLAEAKFSDIPGCGCTALGKYKIGYKYKGRFGDAYKLYGLDSSNSNSFKRNIVLHSYYMVPDKEIYPLPICNSLGCAMISENYLFILTQKIDVSAKPILLWIF